MNSYIYVSFPQGINGIRPAISPGNESSILKLVLYSFPID